MAQNNHNIEINTTVLAIVVFILMLIGVLWLGGNSDDTSPDPQCVAVGNC